MDIDGIHRRPGHLHGSNRSRILPQIDDAERRDKMLRFSGYIAVHDAHQRCAALPHQRLWLSWTSILQPRFAAPTSVFEIRR
jgi:hypothetical protein